MRTYAFLLFLVAITARRRSRSVLLRGQPARAWQVAVSVLARLFGR